ncbi:MAG: type II toxin-antitoxin system HicB family antitoxin [Gammaproteobacteria bacterium]
MKQQSDHYTYRITWSEEDQEYVGSCLEFPSLSHLAKTQSAALKGIIKLIDDIVEDMKTNQEPIPQPIVEKRYSGKFQVRIPPDRHRLLAIKAAEANVSLNRFISDRLCGD